MLVSVVVSARGNGEKVHQLLRALAEQSMPHDQFEVVVVDNDPPGHRRTVTEAVTRNAWSFSLRVVREQIPGLSAGRNRGICVARGRYIAVTDPDIVPVPTWLETLVAAADEEKVFCVGGRTVVEYPEGTTVPLIRQLQECHGAVDWPTGRAPADWPYWATGCNLLFERQAALELGLFRTDLGRRGRWMGDCEDLEFIDRARQAGLSILLEPAAVAIHPIYRRETTIRYYVRQGAGHGVCVARMHQSVQVVEAAIRADRRALREATSALIAGLAFLDRAAAAHAAREYARIATYHLERVRLRCIRRRSVPIPSAPISPVTRLEGATS